MEKNMTSEKRFEVKVTGKGKVTKPALANGNGYGYKARFGKGQRLS